MDPGPTVVKVGLSLGRTTERRDISYRGSIAGRQQPYNTGAVGPRTVVHALKDDDGLG